MSSKPFTERRYKTKYLMFPVYVINTWCWFVVRSRDSLRFCSLCVNVTNELRII